MILAVIFQNVAPSSTTNYMGAGTRSEWYDYTLSGFALSDYLEDDIDD